MKKTLMIITLISVILTSCVSHKKTPLKTNENLYNFDICQDINNSIIDGFFDNDSTKIKENTYLLKIN
jgi:hypothetical protein